MFEMHNDVAIYIGDEGCLFEWKSAKTKLDSLSLNCLFQCQIMHSITRQFFLVSHFLFSIESFLSQDSFTEAIMIAATTGTTITTELAI